MGDDAIHGEVAYYMSENVVGVVPDPAVYQGRSPSDIENGGSGSGSSTHKHHQPTQEVKID